MEKLLSVLLGLILLGCSSKNAGQEEEKLNLPSLLITADGDSITAPESWEDVRRDEILELYRENVFGIVPDQDLKVSFHTQEIDRSALGGRAIRKQVSIRVKNQDDSVEIGLLIYLPPEGKSPIFLGLNFYGNHTIHPDEKIQISDAWTRNNIGFHIFDHSLDSVSRGVRYPRWPVNRILSRGYGLATMYYGELDPDYDEGFQNGIHQLAGSSDKNKWGAISAWSWGLSRALDYFVVDKDVNENAVVVMGHSRMGKAALWAGAQDPRFAAVISNDSGCGGAALFRGKEGERIADINRQFPHWFNQKFKQFDGKENELPVDQHMLMALVAPRPLYVASASQDSWADPSNEYLALYHAGPAFKLYGHASLREDSLPGVNTPRISGLIGYHIRTGKHDITRYDWERFMDFIDKNL